MGVGWGFADQVTHRMELSVAPVVFGSWLDPDTIVLPSELMATHVTIPVCPSSLDLSLPVSASQILQQDHKSITSEWDSLRESMARERLRSYLTILALGDSSDGLRSRDDCLAIRTYGDAKRVLLAPAWPSPRQPQRPKSYGENKGRTSTVFKTSTL